MQIDEHLREQAAQTTLDAAREGAQRLIDGGHPDDANELLARAEREAARLRRGELPPPASFDPHADQRLHNRRDNSIPTPDMP